MDLDASRYALPSDVLARTHTPALVVWPARARRNAERVLALCGGARRWRPHLKTTKMTCIWAELLKLGLGHFKCATLREARQMLELAAARDERVDLLVAYPLAGPALDALGCLARRFPEARLSVLCEDPELVAQIPPEVGVFCDLDPGMHRTGLPADRPGAALAVARAAGRRFRGLHFYEGHVQCPDALRRRERTFPLYRRLLKARARLLEEGLEVGEVVTSGTPAFTDALAFAPLAELAGSVHRVSPGTVVFHDRRSSLDVPELELEPAALVLTRVISRPRPDRATCDAGSKSISADAGDPCAEVVGRPDLVARRPSEEHLPLDATGALPPPERGTELFLVPQHVCTTVNLAEQALVVAPDGSVSVERVGARAHDLWLTDGS